MTRTIVCATCQGRGTLDPDPTDPLARFGRRPTCNVCGGSGSLLSDRVRYGLGNIGPGKSGSLGTVAPKPGDFAKSMQKICSCMGGTGSCDGNCCGGCFTDWVDGAFERGFQQFMRELGLA
jgi:hypothetical protein